MARITDPAVLRALYGAPLERSLKKQLDRLDHHCRGFIAHSPFALLSSTGPDGLGDVTPRGDGPGFVQVIDEQTLLLPDRPGNNRIDNLINLATNPGVGLLFLVPGWDETLRVNGTAEIRDDQELLQRCAVQGRAPRTVLLVNVKQAYLHCAKALMRSRLWDPANRVPRSVLPSFGEMLQDQSGLKITETQDEMVKRYQGILY